MRIEEAARCFQRFQTNINPGNPPVSNGLGVFYVLFATVYLFLLYFLGFIKNPAGVSAPISAP